MNAIQHEQLLAIQTAPDHYKLLDRIFEIPKLAEVGTRDYDLLTAAAQTRLEELQNKTSHGTV